MSTAGDIWIAGACAAFSVDLVVYPLDTIKTRLQSADYARVYRGHPARLYRGVYQGVGSVIMATLPSSGAFFTTYEAAKSLLTAANHRGSGSYYVPAPLVHAAASGTAELVSCAILTPAEVIKQNAQMVDNSRPGRPRVNATLHTIKRFRSNPLALWRGYTALAGRNLPFTAMQFPLFEQIKERIRRYRDERDIRTHTLLESGMITAVSAGAGGSIAAVITTPVDVVKTRLMLSAIDLPRQHTAPTPRDSVKQAKEALVDATGRTSSVTVAREVIRQEGLKGLFRGGALRAVWTMVGSGLYLGVYESGRIYLSQRRGDAIDAEEYART
ncbi:hypothetical protein CERZMDRAFT_69049 [Cercospora zeae-maydis SCOH1-5]|uniref:Mitochondrial carrier protein n=1 Tax=Cercospora zeae-maydis SCOH1-5 TaxID=717836 RepID=A0A6A6FBH7_9PEZI|nr:hypothetical protein CERZMDRAFT_69049 [Cercospora zeae-maydis SCOH1-5]